MKDLMIRSNQAIPPQTCSAEVQAFLRTSADYLGLALDSDCMTMNRLCLPELPVTGYGAHSEHNRRLESQL